MKRSKLWNKKEPFEKNEEKGIRENEERNEVYSNGGFGFEFCVNGEKDKGDISSGGEGYFGNLGFAEIVVSRWIGFEVEG